MRCPFCLSAEPLSKEHLFSKPICDALGVDRSMLVASLDGNTGEFRHYSVLDRRSVRLPCERCNSGWMSELERAAARRLRRWLANPDERLTKAGLQDLTRWLVKTAIVLGFAEVDARRFMSSPTETAIPDITTAKALAAGVTPDHVHVAAARTNNGRMVWGAGNPTVQAAGPNRMSSRVINVAAFNLGPIQLWAIIPIIPPDHLQLPPGVKRLHANLCSRALQVRSGNLDPTQVYATYSDATAQALSRALATAHEPAATAEAE